MDGNRIIRKRYDMSEKELKTKRSINRPLAISVVPCTFSALHFGHFHFAVGLGLPQFMQKLPVFSKLLGQCYIKAAFFGIELYIFFFVYGCH